MTVLDGLLLLLLSVIVIPAISVLSSILWRFGAGIVWLLSGILTLLSPVMFLGGILSILTPGGYEVGVGILIITILAPITTVAGFELEDEKFRMVLCQIVFGAIAILSLPTTSALFIAAVVFSLSGMLGELMVEYEI